MNKNSFKNIIEKFINSIKYNFKLKLFSLMVGFIMWSLVIGDINPVVSRTFENVPINISNKASLEKNKLILVDSNITTINVEVSGTRNDVLKLNKNDILAEASLNDSYNSGTHRLNLKVSVPTNSLKIVPSEKFVSVTLDHEISKDFDVAVEIVGKPKNENQIVTGKTPSDKEVTVTGAASILNKVKKVVAKIDISDIEKTEAVSSKLVAYDEFDMPIKNITLKTEFTSVIVSFSHFKEVPISLATINELDPEIKLLKSEIVPKDVSIIGSPEVLDNITQVITKYFDLSQIKETGVYPLTLDLPKDVSLANSDGKIMVNIDVDRLVKKNIKIHRHDLSIINETKKDFTNDIPNAIEITVSGYESVISGINSGHIKLFVKLTESGDKVVAKFQMKQIDGVELVSTNPEVVNFVEKKD